MSQLASLRMVLSAAAPLYASLEEQCSARIGCPIKQAWGMSELSPLGTMTPDDRRRGGTLGLACPSTELKVAAIDDEGGVDPAAPGLPRGEQGELLIRGPQVMQGYLNAPAKTAETLLEVTLTLTLTATQTLTLTLTGRPISLGLSEDGFSSFTIVQSSENTMP